MPTSAPFASPLAPPTEARWREPAHAGSFYPAEAGRLGRLVDSLLKTAGEAVPAVAPGELVGLLVPHAGLAYSGGIAALGWARLAADGPGTGPPPTVVFAGTNHQAAWLEGVAVWAEGRWETPLGEMTVDEPLAQRIVELGEPFRVDTMAHLREHSIEVQLPFLARMRPDARIVPLLVSTGTGDACTDAGRRLGELLDERRSAGQRVVLVASSDLSHYPPDARARESDRLVLEPILGLDPLGLARREAALRRAGVPGLVCGLCGIEPSVFALAALEEIGARRGVLLGHATSADVPDGDLHRVVGYAAVAFVA